MSTCPLDYIQAVTGDCLNTSSGVIQIEIVGTAPPYTISGSSGYYSASTTATTHTITGLSGGTYSFTITDSCIFPGPNTLYFNVFVSDGLVCGSIDDIENTNCGLNNGSLTASTNIFYGFATYNLYGTSGLVETITSYDTFCIFENLSADTYYLVIDDGGGCTAKTETCLIKSSTTLDYGFYVINDTPCNSTPTSGVGKIFVTGLTGVAPYTYLWSNGQTTTSISGLTSGTYNVTITDNTGCSTIKAAVVGKVESPGEGAIYVTPPTCFASDGTVTIVVTGGTAPFYYSASTGEIAVSFSNIYTFTNVPSGVFGISVTDAGLCKFTTSTIVLTPSSFSVVSVSTTNASCNNVGGQITIQLLAGSPPYTYSLTDSSGNTQSINTSSPTYVFNSLSSDTYTLTITDSSLTCTYVDTFTISNTIKFILTGTTTGTTCNLSNGAVQLGVSGGSGNYRYQITGQPFIDTGFSSYTFNNLSSGTYLASVTDLSDLCVQYLNFNIAASTSVNFTLFPIDAMMGNDGEIYAFITSGTPPFTENWSLNVNGQTGFHMTGLTAGTYTLTVTDNSGCTQTRSIILNGYIRYNSSQTYSICESNFVEAGVLERGPKQMLIEGFYDLTSGDTNCILNEAVFTLETILSGVTASTSFYTGNTLNEYPSDELYADTIKNILEGYGNVGEVVIDIIENTVKIISDCDENLPLMDLNAIVNLKINYDISCQSCGGPIVLNSMSLVCIPSPPFTINDLQFDFSVTGGSGNYEVQVFSGSQWLNFYSFVATSNGDNIIVGPTSIDIAYFFPNFGYYNFRVYDTTYNINTSSINLIVSGCAP